VPPVVAPVPAPDPIAKAPPAVPPVVAPPAPGPIAKAPPAVPPAVAPVAKAPPSLPPSVAKAPPVGPGHGAGVVRGPRAVAVPKPVHRGPVVHALVPWTPVACERCGAVAGQIMCKDSPAGDATATVLFVNY